MTFKCKYSSRPGNRHKQVKHVQQFHSLCMGVASHKQEGGYHAHAAEPAQPGVAAQFGGGVELSDTAD